MTAARLDLRLSLRDRERIDRAVAVAGLPVSTFVRTVVLREADRAVPVAGGRLAAVRSRA